MKYYFISIIRKIHNLHQTRTFINSKVLVNMSTCLDFLSKWLLPTIQLFLTNTLRLSSKDQLSGPEQF